jgi:hypothetical protein
MLDGWTCVTQNTTHFIIQLFDLPSRVSIVLMNELLSVSVLAWRHYVTGVVVGRWEGWGCIQWMSILIVWNKYMAGLGSNTLWSLMIPYLSSLHNIFKMNVKRGHSSPASLSEATQQWMFLVGKPQGNRPLEKPRRRWEIIWKWNLKNKYVYVWTRFTWLR